MTEIGDLALFYRALGDETRLRLVALLSRQRRGSMLCVGRLAEELEVTPSAVSQHIRVLKDLGLAVSQRVGQRIHYRLVGNRLAHYCELARAEIGLEMALSEPIDSDMIQEDEDMCGDKDKGCCCECSDGKHDDPSEASVEKVCACQGGAEGHACEGEGCCCEEKVGN